jgi:hypothetical protein
LYARVGVEKYFWRGDGIFDATHIIGVWIPSVVVKEEQFIVVQRIVAHPNT